MILYTIYTSNDISSSDFFRVTNALRRFGYNFRAGPTYILAFAPDRDEGLELLLKIHAIPFALRNFDAEPPG